MPTLSQPQMKELKALLLRAEVRSFKATWSAGGELSVAIRCKIAAGKDLSPLRELGIEGDLIDVWFRKVNLLRTSLMGFCAMREDITEWDMLVSDPFHHRINGTCGSQADVVFEENGVEAASGEE